MEKASNCCLVRGNEDLRICPKCKEHCEFVYFCDECGEEISSAVVLENDASDYIPINVPFDYFCSEKCKEEYLEKMEENYTRWLTENSK